MSTKNTFHWGEDSFASELETCKAVSAMLASDLDNRHQGEVEHNGKSYHIQVLAYLIDPETGDRVVPPSVRKPDRSKGARLFRVEGYYDNPPQLYCQDFEAVDADEALRLMREDNEDHEALTVTNCEPITRQQSTRKAAEDLRDALYRAHDFVKYGPSSTRSASAVLEHARAALAKAGGGK